MCSSWFSHPSYEQSGCGSNCAERVCSHGKLRRGLCHCCPLCLETPLVMWSSRLEAAEEEWTVVFWDTSEYGCQVWQLCKVANHSCATLLSCLIPIFLIKPELAFYHRMGSRDKSHLFSVLYTCA
jgi:hypothetical protein